MLAKTLRGIARTGVLALAVAGAAVPGYAAAAETWAAYTYLPVATLPGARGLTMIAERIEKETNGELTIRVHVGGSLPINATNISQAVADNIVQIADDTFFTGNIQMSGVVRLPMLLRNDEEYAKAAKIIEPYMTAAYEKKGVVALGEYSYPLQVAFTRKKLTSLAEFKGLKIRGTSPEQGEFVRRFGGSSVTIGSPEVPSAIERGVIDGGFTASSGLGYIWRDLIKYNYRLGINYVNSMVVVNKAAFEKLSPETQKKLRAAVAETMPWVSTTLRQEEADLTQKLAAQGIVVTEPKPEEITQAEKALTSYWDTWAKAHGLEAVEALAKIRAAIGR